MTTQHSPRVTRSQAPLRTSPNGEFPSGEDVLQAALQELRLMRAEREREHAQFEVLLQQRDEELRRLEQRIATRKDEQLSLSDNRACGDVTNNDFRARTSFKLKPDIFDGKVPLRSFSPNFF